MNTITIIDNNTFISIAITLFICISRCHNAKTYFYTSNNKSNIFWHIMVFIANSSSLTLLGLAKIMIHRLRTSLLP